MGKLNLLSPGLRVWLGVLIVVNLVMPWAFWQRVEAQATVVAFMAAFVIGITLFKLQGFTRLLGVMHFTWFPLIGFLWSRLDQVPAEDLFGLWMRAVILLNGAALIFDVKDVIKYVAGDHQLVR